MDTTRISMRKFTETDLLLWPHRDLYLADLLNGIYTIEKAREDLYSLIKETNELSG